MVTLSGITAHNMKNMNYQAIKHELLNSISFIQNPSLHLLLYGDPALPEESNRSIFDHVHNYILKVRRF